MPIWGYEILATISVILKIWAYVPYFRDIIKGKCHPHSFSWFIWFVIVFIVFIVQLLNGAGAGAFTTLAAGLICLAVAIMGIFVGKLNIVKSDYIALASAFSLLPLWYFIHDPLMIVIVITTIDFIGYFPTIRKATIRPYEERWQTFFILSVSSIFALASMEDTSLINMFYIIYLASAHMFTALYILWRLNILEKHINPETDKPLI